MNPALPDPAVPWLELPATALEPTLAGTALPTLVEFWAGWCFFSRLVKPKTRELALEYAGALAVIRCRVEGGEPELARWRIRYLPAVVLIARGRVRRKWYGDLLLPEVRDAVATLQGDTHGAGS